MRELLWVTMGGAAGSAARWLLSSSLERWLGAAFPWGTLAVNVLGSFVVGAVVVLSLEIGAISATARLAITVGLCGGFTTYSTFNHETLAYLRSGAWALAGANVAATLLLCLAAGWGGAVLAGLLRAR